MTAAVYATGGNRCGTCGHEWSDAVPPSDEFRREVMGSWVTDGCAKCRPAPERKPSAGWVTASPTRMTMTAHHLTATVRTIAPVSWDVSHHIDTRDGRCLFVINFGDAPTVAAAQLASEDALRAIAAEILRAVGE